jgi:ferredoxin
MRLDWFLPAIRKSNPHAEPIKRRWIIRWMRKLFPWPIASNWQTKQRGLLRQGLRKLGLSWLSSPLRRLSQTLCFILFLVLFFYVCWPYDAQPSADSKGWFPVEVDPETGVAKVLHDRFLELPFPEGEALFVSESAPDEAESSLIGLFHAVQLPDHVVELQPVEPLTPERLDQALMSEQAWTLSTTEPGLWPNHYAENLAAKEKVAAELFLVIDPLVSLSTAVAARSWVWSLTSAAIILAVCVLIPRGFCGYLCPLGTLIDLFDWSITSRVKRFRIEGSGWWVHIKYYLLLAILVSAGCGVLISGFFAAIPVITRGLMFTLAPLQTGALNGWHQVPPMHAGHLMSLALFVGVLALGFLQPRFWCKYVCPSGAVFSVGNLFRLHERQVESSCISCNKCVEICPFDAIKPDFTTRTSDCTLCQTCAGVCPTQSIKFVERWQHQGLKILNDPPTHETALGRRGFLSATVGSVAAVAGGTAVAIATKAYGAGLDDPKSFRPVRPPGSVPEPEFLEMCIRCSECFKVCPSDVLQPLGFQQGLEGLWTPQVVADWAGCASSCNACGQVCPTGAIRAIPIEEKRHARMGLAILNLQTCLPHAGTEACQLCVDECHSAGYHAIEFVRVGTQIDDDGLPIEESGFLAPVVIDDKCVGCGLCQTRCYGINVKSKHLLEASAIVIQAGDDREDRIMHGSYKELFDLRSQQSTVSDLKDVDQEYLPSFLQDSGESNSQ